MKRVLLYLGMSSTAASKTKTISAERAIRRSDCPEADAPHYKSVVAVAEPFPNDETVSTGTKDEAFFDSETWLESDCDDFFSVQGDKTPSLNASPVHPKKTLRELLSESFDSRKHIDPQIFIDEKPLAELPNTAYKLRRRKSSGSAQHCCPSLMRSLSCSEWKKKRLSPVHIVHC